MWLTFCMRSNNLYKEVVKNHGMRCKPALDWPAIGIFKKAIDDLDIKSERSRLYNCPGISNPECI